ncbi:hypothetical protein BMS3Abin09_00305 [bacterium BMS3Abin09]|nr:hypothetical protein BMS3Abin09_00305 [bacterium BMS3Abin09]
MHLFLALPVVEKNAEVPQILLQVHEHHFVRVICNGSAVIFKCPGILVTSLSMQCQSNVPDIIALVTGFREFIVPAADLKVAGEDRFPQELYLQALIINIELPLHIITGGLQDIA